MAATSRELVLQTLNFEGPSRAPRDLWALPIAHLNHPQELRAIAEAFPSDFAAVGGHEAERPPATVGDPHEPGLFTDDWGCTFTNLQRGVIGEVKTPLVYDWAADRHKVQLPTWALSIDPDSVNRDCASSDKFVFAGCCPQPFERLQYIRTSENLYIDLAEQEPAFLAFVREMHAFHCDLMERWARTDVDALRFNDDWGSQRDLLISPALWRELFKPMYRDFAQIAHARGKKLFMHSDGHILSIYPDLIEIEIDAVNSQLFCMGIDALAPYAGRITFWGEIDRQHLLPFASTDEVDVAVRQVKRALWRDGGCIAQCEFGAAARPENVRQVFATWDSLF